jgi:TonB family protein
MGVLEIVINERGLVESASMRTSISSAYDKLALAATTAWRYKPATIDGEPVKFRKLIQIAVKSDIP